MNEGASSPYKRTPPTSPANARQAVSSAKLLVPAGDGLPDADGKRRRHAPGLAQQERRSRLLALLFLACLLVALINSTSHSRLRLPAGLHGGVGGFSSSSSSAAAPDAAAAYERSYTSALATLGCFVTPGCFPSAKCETGLDPRKIKRGKKWEEQSFCTEDLRLHSGAAASSPSSGKSPQVAAGAGAGAGSPPPPCLVYSFGIHASWEWEEKVARLFGCEVHAFDPTMNHKKDLAPGLTFHKLGLQAVGTDMSRTHGAEYDAIDPSLLLPLNEIMERLGHGNRTIDVLMMDCEGCEWGALNQLACSPARDSRRVRQIVTEFHFQKSLGLETESDVLMAADGLKCLWEERWHVTSIEDSGAGTANLEYARGVPSILSSAVQLLYVSLRRIPSGDKTPGDYLEEGGNLMRAGALLANKYAKYGVKPENWPEEGQNARAELKKRQAAVWDRHFKVARKGRKFDKWEHVEEPEEAAASAA